MQIDVYPTDAEAVDAAAAAVAERLRDAAARGRAIAAIGGGRSGRATLVALAARGDVPWTAVDWFLADERCGDAADALAHAKVARDSLFGPRGVQAARVHVPAVQGIDPATAAARYAEELVGALGPSAALDVVVLGIGEDGALGTIVADAAIRETAAWVAALPPAGPGEPSRITITPALVARARHVVVTAVGPGTARAVAAALRDGRGAAAEALPSERVAWIVDRAAAAILLEDATEVADHGSSSGGLHR
jgi:6-phosphogluconolactonase/glucosamine-6-phosphate isomerase/deaminase